MPKHKTVYDFIPHTIISRRRIFPVPPDDPCWSLEDDMPDGICITSKKCYPSAGFVYFPDLGAKGVYESEWKEFTSHIQDIARWNSFDAAYVKHNIKLLSLLASCTGILWAPFIHRYYHKRRMKIEYRNLRSYHTRLNNGRKMTLNDLMAHYNETFFSPLHLRVKLYIPARPDRSHGPHCRVTILLHEKERVDHEAADNQHDTGTQTNRQADSSPHSSSWSRQDKLETITHPSPQSQMLDPMSAMLMNVQPDALYPLTTVSEQFKARTMPVGR